MTSGSMGSPPPFMPSGFAGLAVLHRLEGLEDLELRALASGEEHILVDMLAVHRHAARGAVEAEILRRGHAFAGIAAARFLDQGLGAVHAREAIDADDAELGRLVAE